MQGNEIYAASRVGIHLDTKLSLHSGGGWQVRMGHSVHRLAPALPVPGQPDWQIALRWSFLVDPGALPPQEKIEGDGQDVSMLDVPEGQKLDVFLVQSRTDNPPPSVPEAWLPHRLTEFSLRAGRRVIVMAHTGPFSPEDRHLANYVRRETRMHYEQEPPTSGVCAELHLVYGKGHSQNVLRVIPLGRESFVRRPQSGAA